MLYILVLLRFSVCLQTRSRQESLIKMNKSILIGNGFNINFGGAAYTNQFIIKRIIFNARAKKYDVLFDGQVSGDEIAQIFFELAQWTNDIASGKYDAIIPAKDIYILEDFKSRYNWKLEHYYEVGLEDWLFILYVYFLSNDDIMEEWIPARQGFERMMLDAIYNDGDIQVLHTFMGKPVKRWLKEFDNIFTLNYDNNIEDLTQETVYHLHGDYRTPANSENPHTLLGYSRIKASQSVVVPGFEHCNCNALFDYAGEHKFEVAETFEKGEEGFHNLEKGGISSPLLPAPIASLVQLHQEHPELAFGTPYHFRKLKELTGELHIVGMSPNNDAHIFRLIDESAVEKVIFYGYSESEMEGQLPLRKEVKCKSVTDLWRQLDALPKKYSCNYPIPDSPKLDKFLDILNAMSFDPASKADTLKAVNAIPKFQSDELCRVAMQKVLDLSELGTPRDEQEQQRQFREISRIALRHGVLPTALYVHIMMNQKA